MNKDQITETARMVLKKSGLRVTHSRLNILCYLMEEDKPVTAEQVADRVSSHLVTVYRNLKDLSDRGVLYQTDFRTGRAYFEYQKDHHHHITCLSCGYREHLSVCLPDGVWREVGRQACGFTGVEGHSLEFFGHCRSCVCKGG